MNINPIIILVSQLLGLYGFALLVYIIMQWLMHFDIINKRNANVGKIFFTLQKITEPVLSYVRKFIPTFGGMDISPIIVFLLINFIRNVLFTYFYVR